MKQFIKKTISLFVLPAFLVSQVWVAPVLAAPIDTAEKYAWSSDAGWINFNPTNGNVSVTNTGML